MIKGLKKFLKVEAIAFGILFNLLLIWMILGLPYGFDQLLIISEKPIQADYIVCVSGGLTGAELPTDDGWQRIYTAIQLYLDGWAGKIIFTGGGSSRLSEAEGYAEAAGWLGMAPGDAILDPGPNRTSEHSRNILNLQGLAINTETRLNIVTTPLHSKRTMLCFKKAGFKNIRMVVAYKATGKRTVLREDKEVVVSRPNSQVYLRDERESRSADYKPSDKAYNDILFRMRGRADRLLSALREWAALAAYKLKGYI